MVDVLDQIEVCVTGGGNCSGCEKMKTCTQRQNAAAQALLKATGLETDGVAFGVPKGKVVRREEAIAAGATDEYQEYVEARSARKALGALCSGGDVGYEDGNEVFYCGVDEEVSDG